MESLSVFVNDMTFLKSFFFLFLEKEDYITEFCQACDGTAKFKIYKTNSYMPIRRVVPLFL